MIWVTAHIVLQEHEIEESFIRASGPGGQNVNKVASAVQLRFNVRASPSISDDVRERLTSLCGQRMTLDGIVVITAQRFRSQERNRADALERLIALIRQAAISPAKRRPTRPTLSSQRRRLDAKANRASTKTMRGRPSPDD